MHPAAARCFSQSRGRIGGLYEPDPSGTAPLVEVACWAHSRSKLFDVHANTGSALAQQALERIAALFRIEGEINGRHPERGARSGRSGRCRSSPS